MRAIILCTLLAGCGSSNKSDNDSPAQPQPEQQKQAAPIAVIPQSMAIADAAALPACDEAHNQQLVYVLADKQFQTCQAGAWQVIDIAPPAPKQSVADVVAALGSFVLLKPIAEQDPRAQALLGAKYVTTKALTADTDTCNAPHTDKDGTEYSGPNSPGYTDGASGVIFSIEVRAGVVTNIFYKVDDKPSISALADCSKF